MLPGPITGLRNLRNPLNETGCEQCGLVIQGHVEPGDPNPTELITSWFADVVIQANGDGYFGVSISERLKPYLLQVKREFFKYRLAYVLHLRRAMLFGSISGQSVGNIAVSAGSRLASFAL
jgi:hypothetical protein